MIRAEQSRQLVAPIHGFEFLRDGPANFFHRDFQSGIASHGDGELDFWKPGQAPDQLRRGGVGGVNNVKNAPAGFIRRRQPHLARLREDGADRKTERLHLFRGDPSVEKHRSR